MKKFTLTSITIALTAMVLSFTSCASNPAPQPTAASSIAQEQVQQQNPNLKTFPCLEFDTLEDITGWGEFKGSSAQQGRLVELATEQAKRNARQKLSGRYKGITSSYLGEMGNNQGNDIIAKIEAGGDEVIDRVLSDAMTKCALQGEIDKDGHQSVYIGIRISREKITNEETANAVAKSVANRLTEDEKMKIRFEESQFRERYKGAFQEFKKENTTQQ